MGEGVPAFLTIEEVMALLRIGRTKAYGLTAEWLRTGGKSGLRVASRNPMRIPRAALEELAGGPLDADLLELKTRKPATPPPDAVPEPRAERSPSQPRRSCRSRTQPPAQPGLFDLPPAS